MKVILSKIINLEFALMFNDKDCYVFWIYSNGMIIVDLLEIKNDKLTFKESISKEGLLGEEIVIILTEVYLDAKLGKIQTFSPTVLLTHQNREMREIIKLYFNDEI